MSGSDKKSHADGQINGLEPGTKGEVLRAVIARRQRADPNKFAFNVSRHGIVQHFELISTALSSS